MGLRQEINPYPLFRYSSRLPSGLVASKSPVPAALQRFCWKLLKSAAKHWAELHCFVRNLSLNVPRIHDVPGDEFQISYCNFVKLALCELL